MLTVVLYLSYDKNYKVFDDGHEWWGTACWSVYDKCMNRYTVIMAGATD